MPKLTCKICRRVGISLCGREKCALRKKPYPPGAHGQKRGGRKAPSEFGQQLLEKQKIQHTYHLSERQFHRYIKEALQRSREGTLNGLTLPDFVAKKLETRLDSVVFRLGFALSRSIARQRVSHGHFLVNGRRVDIPSYVLAKGDRVTIRPESMKLAPFTNFPQSLKKASPPAWLALDKETLVGEVAGVPNAVETAFPGDLSMVIEYYSR